MSCRRCVAVWMLPLVIVSVLCGSSRAQPNWVKEAVRRGASVTPHKDASLLVLHNSGTGRLAENGNFALNMCWAAKILDNDGIGQAGLSEYVSSNRKVENLKGWLIRPDGSRLELDKKQVYEIDLDHAAGFYDDARSLEASFKDVNPGDIVAYEYTVEEKDPLTGYYLSFMFQLQEPVLWTKFEIEVPAGWKLLTSAQQIDPITYINQANTHVWSAENLPFRPSEPHMPSWSKLSRSLRVGCYDTKFESKRGFPDWRAVVAWERALKNVAFADSSSLTATVDRLCEGLDSPEARLRAIARFVQKEIRYVAVEIGIGRFQPRPVGRTLANKYGDCKDKAALLRGMLARSGILSESVIASLGEKINPEFPSPFQFNHVIVAIPVTAVPNLPAYPDATVDGWLYFDPTKEFIPLGSLSSDLRGSYVLKTSANDSTVTRLPLPQASDERRCYRAVAELLPDFQMKAEVKVIDYGITAAESQYYNSARPAKEVIEGWQKRFADVVQAPTLTDFASGADGDSAWVSFVLTASRAATLSGTYCLLTTDFFHDDRADDLTAPERVHPITFGTPADITTDVEWRLPQSWTPGGEPVHMSDSCQLASLSCEVTNEGGLHLISRAIYFGGDIPPDKYEEARRFNKSLRASQRLKTFINRTGD